MFNIINSISEIVVALYVAFIMFDMFKFANDEFENKSDRLKAINNLLLAIIVAILMFRL